MMLEPELGFTAKASLPLTRTPQLDFMIAPGFVDFTSHSWDFQINADTTSPLLKVLDNAYTHSQPSFFFYLGLVSYNSEEGTSI